MSTLKPVGVFWDIENCCVPKGKSALKIIERIRERFFQDFREAEFMCVCDINKESEATIKDLNDGQINVVHITAVAKNAADDKIRQSLRRFSDSHPQGTRVILLSSDVNFAPDLSDLRHRKKFDVVLIHKEQVNDALLTCATEHHLYEDLIRDLPERPGVKDVKENILVVHGYSKEIPQEKIRQVLKMLSNNCGGKVLSIGFLFAIMKFDTPELLERAKKRMNGEDVYGRKITVCLPEETSFYNTVRKLTAANLSKRQESPSPQRRPGRERTSSRGFTPDPFESARGGNMAGSDYPSYWYDPSFGGLDQSQRNDNSYKTHTGPVRSQAGLTNNSGFDLHGNSPSHTHTLPNSNSEKYYSTKSGPSSLESSPSFLGCGNKSSASSSGIFGSSKVDSGVSNTAYVLGDLSNAASSSGETITVFKPAKKQSLADIPIPSFGFRDIPPPLMPSAVASTSNTDSNNTTFDPIQLVEMASQDSVTFMASQSKLLGPRLVPDHPESQPPSHPTMQSSDKLHSLYYSNSKMQESTYFTPVQTSSFTRHQPAPPSYQPHQHQSRSLSVPAQNAGAGMLSVPEDVIPKTYNNTSQDTVRSKSQNSNIFKEPTPVHNPYRNVQNPVGYQSHGRRTGSRSGSREPRNSVSSDEDRPFSPNLATGRQNFRPRLASAPSSRIITASPTNRTPSPLTGPSLTTARQHASSLYRVPTPAEIGDPSTDYIHPEFPTWTEPYVELAVSNLDYNIHPRDWRKIIYATFHPHVKILSIQVRLQADNTSVATVRLPSEQDARFAIAQFHRRKIGYKKINVQYKTDCSQSPADSLRTDTIALLMEAKENKMPLSRLIDLFDKRFHKNVSVSDIYKMRDTVQILEVGGAGRWVRLQAGIRRSPTPIQGLEEEAGDILDQPVCNIHCPEGSVHYTEALNCCMLPNVLILRKHFSPQLHSLLLSHNGYIPLMSFPYCFADEFKPLEPVRDGGVPLEHVISCVPGVEIVVLKAGVKVIQFQENRDQFYDMMKGNSWQELGKISREVMELLRQQPTCTMPVSKFIPSYHHYFGRQCRVADYGYTKLQELFEAIPHAIQILGTGDRKVITLSPRAQLKRFATDIVKVVRSQPAKQITLSDFPKAFEKVMGKPLILAHYGVCFMEDVLMDIPTTTLIVIEEENNTLLALPRRDQTPEEVERTKQFALEVVDILKHNPQCRMPFTKFIPAYHHHFGRQCRVADYGFSKLTDLFESIAHVVEIDEDEERMIHLSPAELRKVLCHQLTSLIRSVGPIPVSKILEEYARHFGFCLKLEDFGADSVKSLLLKLKNHIKIEVRDGQECAKLVNEFQIPQLGLQVMQLLMDESGGSMPVMELCMRYESKFGHRCDVGRIREELFDYVQIDESEFDTGGIIRLTSQQMLGRNLRLLLLHHGRIVMSDLSNMYREQYGVELSPGLYDFSCLYQLLLSFPHILEVKGKPSQKYIQSAGMLAVPDTLPPSRVDVTSPVQFHLQSSCNLHETICGSTTSGLENPCAVPTNGSISDLLRHASQLWDPSMAQQATPNYHQGIPSDLKTSSNHIMDLITGKMNSCTLNGDETHAQASRQTHPTITTSSQSCTVLSANGVPVAWQMKAGGDKIVSGNVGATSQQVSSSSGSPSCQPKKKSPKPKKSRKGQIRILPRNPGDSQHSDDQPRNSCVAPSSYVDDRGDKASCDKLLLPGDTRQEVEEENFSPLDTSSAYSQHSSSSHSSTASPKRKNRIAANFKVS